MIGLIRYYLGFVKLRVNGAAPERLINRLISEGISVWGIKRKTNYIELCISFKDYLKIREIRKAVDKNLKVELLSKVGFPVFLKRFFMRKSLLLGILLILIVNVFLSQFIWRIEIEGIKTLESSELMQICEELGVTVGVYSKNLDTYDLSQKIALRSEQIAWVSVNIEGSKLTLNVSEAETSEQMSENPSNLVAAYDGVIRSLKVSKGTETVTLNQAVRQGEILVSGIETVGERVGYVRAEAEILAETYRTFQKEIDKQFIYEKTDGEFQERSVLEFFGVKIPLYLKGVSGLQKSTVQRRSLSFNNCDLPICITTRTYFASLSNTKEIGEEDAKNLALHYVSEEIRSLRIVNVEKYTVKAQDLGDRFLVTVDTVCLEDIGESKNISPPNC